MTLRQLEIFAAVAQHASFTRAAESLLLSEPSVSQQIALLEHAVGVRLFDREPRHPVTLTEEGRKLLAASEDIFRRLSAVMQELSPAVQTTRVRLGAEGAFSGHLLPLIYASLAESQTGINLSIEGGTQKQLLEALVARQLDLVIAAEPQDVPDLAGESLAAHDQVLVMPSGHPWAGRAAVPFKELASQRLILPEAGTLRRRAFDQVSARFEGGVQASWEIRNEEARVTAAVSGLGVALVSYYVAGARLADGSLAVLPAEGFPIRLTWRILWRDGYLSGSARTVRDHFLGRRDEIEALSLCPQPAGARRP